MRNSHNITIAESDTFNADDETIWSLPGPWSVLWRGCWRWAFHVLCMALTRCFSSYTAVFPCIAACRDCGGNSPALVIEGTIVPEHDVYPADGGADVWGIVYVAAGLGYLPSLYMATEAETRTGHNSNRNQQ